jgi:hypothetical protein
MAGEGIVTPHSLLAAGLEPTAATGAAEEQAPHPEKICGEQDRKDKAEGDGRPGGVAQSACNPGDEERGSEDGDAKGETPFEATPDPQLWIILLNARRRRH